MKELIEMLRSCGNKYCADCPDVEECAGPGYLMLKAAEALEKIAPVGDVYPDWYSRLSELDYDYDPVKDGTPWYRADDVWACIEEASE